MLAPRPTREQPAKIMLQPAGFAETSDGDAYQSADVAKTGIDPAEEAGL